MRLAFFLACSDAGRSCLKVPTATIASAAVRARIPRGRSLIAFVSHPFPPVLKYSCPKALPVRIVHLRTTKVPGADDVDQGVTKSLLRSS